jgi:hypothetical protein
VSKKVGGGGNDFAELGIALPASHPPAPLTGDVGRGCGDASRALLFFAQATSINQLQEIAPEKYGNAIMVLSVSDR